MSSMCKVSACDAPAFEDGLCMGHFKAYSLTSFVGRQAEKSFVVKKPCAANEVLSRAQGHMEDRAVTYDNPEGERSMGKTVQMFNTLSGNNLTEEEGWLFMAILKMVRSSQGDFKADNYEDGAAYFALACEAASKTRS